jgi:hypothetical protein
MAQNIQTFAGDVVVPGTLKANLVTIEDPILTLGSNNYVDKASNTGLIINRFDSNANVAFYFDETNEQLRLAYTASVGTDKNIVVDENTDLEINVFGYVSAYGFRGDGGLLSNLVTDLQSVTEYGASSDQTLVLSNVTTALDATEGNVVVAGNVTASTFFGDGANLTGIAATLEEIIINGNVTSNTMELQNATSLITTGKVGIANSAPQHDLSVGANLYVEDVGSNVLTVEGNISAHQLTLGTIEITPGYGLENVTNISNISYQTLILSNAQTAFVSTAKAGIGIEPDAADVGAAGLHVDGHLRLGGAADNTDEEAMDIKAAGALNVLANESDTDNTNTGLLLRAGGVNESNITMYGDLSTADKQYMSFATRSEERMRIHGDGNVSIGHTTANYMLDVAGDANCVSLSIQDLTINTIGLSVLYDVDNILENGNVTTNVLTVGKVTVTDPTLAQTASNLVTWNPTTSEFEDSGGLISNKLAIVSEQPPSALTANSTTVTNHGVYKVTTSGLATDSNAWNAFDDDTAVAWTSVDIYKGTSNVYDGVVQLSSDTSTGEWLAVELPYKATLRYVKLTPSAVASYPTDADLYATNDNISWDLLKEWTGVVPASASEEQTVFVNASEAYKRYAIVTTKVAGDSITASLAEWKLFCESFTVDGGKVKLASSTITGGNTVVDQTGPHARASPPLRKYPEVAMTSNVQGGYMVNVSSADTNSSRTLIGAFDGIFDDSFGKGWQSRTRYSTTTGLPTSDPDNATFTVAGVDYTGQWVKLELPQKIRVESIILSSCYNTSTTDDRRPENGVFLGSNDDTNWEVIKTFNNDLDYNDLDFGQDSTADRANSQATISGITNTSYYKYLMIVITKIATTNQYGPVQINELEYYGYEETSDPDTSVDTTITSQFNLPDTTGVKLYIDGDKGSTATDLSGEGHTLADDSESFSGNAWSFSSLSTSNVTMTSGDLAMEGDHPHSVSLWFNAANVSSNATLFHVGTAAGEGDAKTSISLTESGHLGWIDGGDNQFLSANTWHNLVYATQGGGGVRTCYLDGRKLGDAQVQDTFGEYPPFAMTTYSEYGYTVSASTDAYTNGSFKAWRAFNNTIGNEGWHAGEYNDGVNWDATFNGTDNAYSGTRSLGGVSGEWLKLELPFRLKLSYLMLASRDTSSNPQNQGPQDLVMMGSNDDVNWTTIKTVTGLTPAPDNEYDTIVTNAQKAYKYIAMVCTKVFGAGGFLAVGELRYFGHKENDTTRFPVSSTVLKYPHVAMTAQAQRGYVATNASNTHTGGTSIQYSNTDGYKVFNNDVSSYYFGLYDSGTNSPYVTTTGYWDTANYPDLKLSSSSGTPAGDWVSIEMPRKLTLQSVEIASADRSTSISIGESARDFEIWATNDNSSWTRIHQTIDATAPTASGEIRSFDVNASVAYKRFALIVTRNGSTYTGATGRPVIVLGLFNLYGTEPEDVVARVGEGLDGKVANFRVYDKYLHEEQALELWDAQKDQFGRAESSVVVHKGRLGVGTTEPEGRFAVLDEAHESEEFPPRAMTDYETYMEGHGVFRIIESSHNSGDQEGWRAFEDTWALGSIGNAWLSDGSPSRYNADGTPTSNAKNINGVLGEYLILESPYKVKMSHVLIYPRAHNSTTLSYSNPPKTGKIWGSNDLNELWTEIVSYENLSYGTTRDENLDGQHPQRVNIHATRYYKYIAFQVTVANHTLSSTTVYTNIQELRYFGTRERGQSTLHDGQMTLTKNLTVPRIGPALDADDTPRRDRLVVEYNTSTNPTANGTVKDTSGRGLDGLVYNDASYDAAEKALVFDGTGDYIKTCNLGPNLKGNQQLTASLWFKTNEDRDQNLFNILPGDSDETDLKTFGVRTEGDSTNYNLRFYYWNADYTYNVPALDSPQSKWFHLVVMNVGGTKTANGTTYDYGDPSNRRLFLNGVELFTPSNTTYASAVTGSATDLLDLEPNSRLMIGARHKNNNEYPLNGSISNFKIWDVALTAEEVKRLYDMGRCDEGHHVVNFSKTQVGIGLGDGEAPRADFDVRGVARFHQIDIRHDTEKDTVINFSHYLNTAIKPWQIGQIMGLNPTGANNSDFKFATNGVVKAWIDSSSSAPTTEINNFTGQHRTFIKDVPFSRAGDLGGLIVSSDQNKYIKMSGGIEAGSNAITTNESLPVVSLSTTTNDKKCFGVISASEDPETRQDRYGNIISVSVKEKGDTRVYINSVGEGAIWVSNIGGSLEAGDYITTSNVAGYGQRQESEFLANYTVAKITMDCDFNPQDQPIQRIKQSNVVETHYTGLVPVVKGVPHEWVTTTVTADDEWSNVSVSPSDVTYAEWSNLEANVQNTYTLTHTQTSNVVYDVKYTKTTTANVTAEDAWDAVHIEPSTVTYAEYSNLEANVQNTYSLTYTMTTKVEATEANYSNLSTEDKEFFVPTYYQLVEQTVDAEYPGAVKHETVTDRLENALDEHGQLQWEDDPSGVTEKAYKIRYLDATGQQTDEANCVHRAAFVGCTYHCG